jgi:hypothetical protein
MVRENGAEGEETMKTPIEHGPRNIPPIRMKWGHLCQNVQFHRDSRGEGATVGQLVHSLGRPGKADRFPVGCIATVFDASNSQGLEHTLRVGLVTYPDSHELASRDYPITFHSIGDGYRNLCPMRIDLTDWAMPPAGDYAMEFRIGGEKFGEMPVRLFDGSEPRKMLPPPARDEVQAVEAGWMHLLGDTAGFREGIFTRIVDHLRLPSANSTINLNGAALVAQCRWKPVDGAPIARKIRVRFLNGRGKNVAQGDQNSDLEMQFWSENQLAARLFIPFHQLPLAQDDYTFELYMDGVWVKTLDFSILPPEE